MCFIFVQILHLKQTARRVLDIVTEYTDMPPVVEKVTKVVKKVTKLFKDIKNDVMKFYEVTFILCYAFAE